MSDNTGMPPLVVPCGDPGFLACHAAFWILSTAPIVLLAVGTVGNILSLAVLSRERMRKNAVTMYLICLAVSDLIFLWVSVINLFLRLQSIDVQTLSVFNCKLHDWVASWSICLSIWLLVILTKERLLFTVFPINAKRFITKRYVITCLTLTIVVTSLISCHFVFGNTIQERPLNGTGSYNGTDSQEVETWCGPSPDEEEYIAFRQNWSKILMSVYNIVPFLLICIGNVIIAVTLSLQKRRVNAHGNPNQKTKSLTKVLFALSACFLSTTTPYSVFMFIYSRVQSSPNGSDFAKFQLGYAIVSVCLLSNSVLNFFLYCISGTVFRSEFKDMLTNVSQRLCKRFTTQNTGTSTCTSSITR